MRELGWSRVAVNYQQFRDDAQRYAHMTADNAIGTWSDLDLKDINQVFTDFGPEFNVDMLGIEDFIVEPIDKLDSINDILQESKPKDSKEIECPNCGERFTK